MIMISYGLKMCVKFFNINKVFIHENLFGPGGNTQRSFNFLCTVSQPARIKQVSAGRGHCIVGKSSSSIWGLSQFLIE